MRIDKYFILSFLAIAVTLLVGAGSYFISLFFSKEVFLKTAVENAENYAEVVAVSTSSVREIGKLKRILERAPYIERVVFRDVASSSPFILKKEFVFPDGKLLVSIFLDREQIEEKTSLLAKKVAFSVVSLTGALLFVYLLGLRLLYLEPLHSIRSDIDKIYKGAMEKLPYKGADEFGRIRESINRMIDSIRERDERAEIISGFIQLLTVGEGFNGEFIELMRKTLKITGADGVIVGLISEDEECVRVKLITNEEDKEYCKGIKDLEGLEPYLIEIRKEVETDKVSLLPSLKNEFSVEYIYGMPLTIFSQVLGYVIFFKRNKEPIKEENKLFIKNVAKSISVAVEIAQLISSLRKQLEKEKELIDECGDFDSVGFCNFYSFIWYGIK